MKLVVDSLSHTFHDRSTRKAIEKIAFEAETNQFLAVIGPSGCGKSTLLRVIADLLEPTGGTVWMDGERPDVWAERRRTAWMSQSPALLPWLTVRGNVELALHFHAPEFAPRLTTEEALESVGLKDVMESYPGTLSGGMQQRLALARTLVMDAEIWLMDEPFASLDELTRERLTQELLGLWETNRPMVLWVTHNIHEAIRLSDRILVFSPHPGRLVADLWVDLPRPREESSLEFQTLLEQVREILEQTSEQQEEALR